MKKYLIVGLGNIGAEYVNTRHNIGFKIVDFVAQQQGLSFETAKLGAVTEYSVKGRKLILLKPNTYMNLSGKAVHYWMEKENIPKENVLVITDDLNLPFGTIRIKGKGSDGGHNGLKNIDLELNGNNYPRLKFGIGNNFSKGRQADYILGKFKPEELVITADKLKKAKEMVLAFGTIGLERTMNLYNE